MTIAEFSDLITVATKVLWSIVPALGGGALLVLAFSGWLGKVWAHRLMERDTAQHSKELEAFRTTEAARNSKALADITAEHSRTLESFRTELRNQAFQSETRFSRLHEKQAESIGALSEKLYALITIGRSYLNTDANDPNISHERSRYYSASRSFIHTFSINAIYFDPGIAAIIDNIVSQLEKADLRKELWEKETDAKDRPDEVREWLEARTEFLSRELPDLQNKLMTEFRRLLGVIPAKGPSDKAGGDERH